MTKLEIMTEYQIFCSGRTRGCSGAISHLGVMEVNEMWKIEMIIDMIENKKDMYWTYFYKNGLIERHIKLAIEVVTDPANGKYLRTHLKPKQKDSTSHVPKKILNNLLELPIFFYKNEKDKWYRCKI
jgi:hypothetical protein